MVALRMVSFEAMLFIAFLAVLCGLALGVFFICIVLRFFYVESEGIVSVRSRRTEEEGGGGGAVIRGVHIRPALKSA